MAFEKRWSAIPAILFLSNGGQRGQISVSDASNFKVKQQVTIKANTLDSIRVEVKSVIDNNIEVGTIGKSITDRTVDLSLYTTALSATIEAEEQERTKIPIVEHERAVYEEEPTVAKRVIPVNKYGKLNAKDSPLYVELSDGSISIGTVNAEIEVQLSHIDNDPDTGDIHDSVRIGDGAEILQINSDGSINVNIIESPSNQEQSKNIYNEALNVVSGFETKIVDFVATSALKRYSLQRIEFTGEQIALYRAYINGQKVATKRTHHGSGLSGGFEFMGGSQEGIFLSTGDTVELKVLHNRPSVGDFEGRIQIFEISL